MFGSKKKKVNKIDEVKKTLIAGFDIDAYLEANPDVKKGIEKGQFQDALQHLELFGLDEIQNGDRRFHKDLNFYSEAAYLTTFPEVEALVKNGEFSSVFDHFCKVGYSELLEQLHNTNNMMTPTKEVIPADKSLIKDFDKEAYLEANPDVKIAVKKGDFPNIEMYLRQFGLKRIEAGDSKFHNDLEPFSRTVYLKTFQEVEALVKSGEYSSAFDHFCKVGYSKLLEKQQDKNKLIQGFDEDVYVEANPFIKEAIEKGKLKDALTHLELYGLDEIQKGKRIFHPDIKPFNEMVYLEMFPEAEEMVKREEYSSVFDHFCKVGYSKLLKKQCNGSATLSKNKLDICAIIPKGKEKSSFAVRLISSLTLDSVKDKVYFKALSNDFRLNEILEYDACIVQQNAITDYKKAENLINILKTYSIQLIVDIDDTLKKKQKHKSKITKLLLDNADTVWSPTQKLIDFYISKAKQQVVIPDVLDPKHSQKYSWKEESLEHLALSLLQTIKKSNTFIQNSNLFDKNDYLSEYEDLKEKSVDPLWHYSNYGWKENRLPSVNFDVFWYQEEYLQDYISPVNPVLHYEIIGKQKGYKTKPVFKGLGKKVSIAKNPKRICLFAAYDKDGVVDESVLILIKELSKYSDVYFLSDSNVPKDELKKLKPYTKGAWGYRHGEYDFGSYKRLASEHVGWETVESYDELLFVNDSSYLISPLDKVFKKMDKKKTSWWGMQATKGMYATKDKESNQFKTKIPMSDIKERYLDEYLNEDVFDFHIGSYFLVFRKNIIKDKKFQNIINGITKQRNKKTLILKYEFGLAKYLIADQYDFETYMDDLYPFHPIYTDEIYKMIKNGYPLFKRFFITENHYKQEKLYTWKEKLLALHPELDIEPIESNIVRAGDATKLYQNLDIEKNGQELLTNDEFLELDKKSIVDKNVWIFPVCGFNHNLDDNTRAVYNKVKDDEKIKKVILYRSKFIHVEGKNVEKFPLHSREGQEALLQSSVIFIKHTVWRNTFFPIDTKKHKCINLWHGIPLKRIGYASRDLQGILDKLKIEHQKCISAIASSSIDRMAMASTFYPLTYNDIWVTGLPRHDFIMRKEKKLPFDMLEEMNSLRTELKGRKLILFAPTFRNDSDDGYYDYSAKEKKQLYKLLKDNNAVLGIREHMADSTNSYSNELRSKDIIDLSSAKFPNIEILYRLADILITDYSSCFIDFMLTGKPMLSFAYDLDNYSEEERGFFYDIDMVFPGKICKDFDSLHKNLGKLLVDPVANRDTYYDFKRRIFFDYVDDQNSKRLVDKVKEIINK